MHDAVAQFAVHHSLREGDVNMGGGGGGGDEEVCAANDPNLYIKIMGTIIFVVVWPFIVLDMKWFPLGRPAAALLGGVLMVVFNIVSQAEVYEIEGEKGNLQTMFLLVGMMILSYYFDREGLLRLVSLWIFGHGNKPFHAILWKVCILSAALSAFVTNDATCLVVTPLLLSAFCKQGRNRKELLPLCLGIATSANIGSAATVFGNPQNAFIASAAGVALIDFFIAELPAALIGTAVSIGLLYIFFFRIIFKKGRYAEEEDGTESIRDRNTGYRIPGDLAEERASVALSYDQSGNPTTSQLAKERELMYSTEKISGSSSFHQMPKDQHVPRSASNPVLKGGAPAIKVENVDKQNGVDMVEPAAEDNTGGGDYEVDIRPLKDRSIRDKIFILWLLFISVLLVVLLAIPPPPTVNSEFNLGCIPIASAVLTMLADTIINKRYAYESMLKIDWTVILMFMGLFIWLGGFQNTCFPYIIFNELAPYMNLYKFEGVLLFSVFVIIGSNIFSNVPLVILIVHRIDELCGDVQCEGPLGGLLLAWISTIAGNFTLIGSVANLIVAEKARSSADYRLTFWNYIKFGFISTIVVIYLALPIVYFLGRVA
ncbi:PREDICTED: putative transporter arsB [Amphimedon queenslandica]|uniref:Citrate transporter-like domain-containing protein n=1 Tax=Amphimedon queenslandica TaxID=400682 RepID=A0A1X7UZZ2_AMPQE|nr:PREDICTED: putative transporter arsB [Amphimedon queenslandica]|eukprot:XP_003386169.1 PREDICTED: putative transporter arsB [Amphimedon queenslandica]